MIEIPQEIKKALSSIGLDRAEIQVFVLLLRGGILSIQELTSILKLPRSSVHLACENLLARGVIKISITGKRRSFYIDNPNTLENFLTFEEHKLQTQKISLKSILPKLTAEYVITREVEPIDVQELHGEDGFVEAFYQSLELPKNSEVFRFGGDPTRFTVAREKLKEYREKRMKKKIYSKMLLPEGLHAQEEIKDARFKMREVRMLPQEVYNPNVQVSVWGEKTSITVWDKGLHSVILRNKALADFMKQLFEISWSNAKKN